MNVLAKISNWLATAQIISDKAVYEKYVSIHICSTLIYEADEIAKYNGKREKDKYLDFTSYP